MPWEPRISGIRRFLRVSERTITQDIDDEIAFHVESRTRELVHAGHDEPTARRLAEVEFGDLLASRIELTAVDRRRRRRERARRVIESIGLDLRHANRALSRSPAFVVTAVMTLALGIGTAVAIFAVVNGVLLRPLPFRQPDRLVGAWHDFPPLAMTHGQQSATTFFTYRTQARSIDGIAVYQEGEVNVSGNERAGPPQRLTTAFVSATLFPVLGVAALKGRVLADDDDHPTSRPVLVVSEATWRTMFGGDPDIIGRALEVNGVRREIVGVMANSFRFPSAQTALWIPLGLDPINPPPTAFAYSGVARLKAGVSITDAQREFAQVLPRIVELYPKFVPGITTRAMVDQVQPRPVLTRFRDDVTGEFATTLWLVACAATLLLAVACLNVANLAVVRADARQREFALRAALGAGRVRIFSYLFSEAVIIVAIAELLGVGTAWVALHALVSYGPPNIPRISELGMDGSTVLFATLLGLVVALTCATIPAVRLRQPGGLVRGAGRSTTAGRPQQRLRDTLVVMQLALGLVALASSGLLLRSFRAIHAVRPGFDADHVATMWVSLPRARYESDSSLVRFYASLVDRVSHLPGVISAGVASRLPLVDRGISPNPLYPASDPTFDRKLPPLQLFTTVGGDFFSTLRIPLLAGRLFTPFGTQREGEAVISASTARMFWRDSTGVAALGQRFRTLPTRPWYTVIGVVADAHDTSLSSPASPTIYFAETARTDTLPWTRPATTMALVIRTAGDPASAVAMARAAARDLDPTLPTFDVETLASALSKSTSRLAFTLLILGTAAAITLLLGVVGLYGVMAYTVALRRREIGIRLALGASPRRLALSTTRHGLALTAVGAGAGVLIYAAMTSLMRALLFGVAPWDPLTVGGAACALLAFAVLASWVPARRAARIDPVDALRAD